MTQSRMLEGIRIVDLTTVIFGPYGTQILADLGADVIKIEPPEGDACRLMGTPSNTSLMGPVHLRLNRGKRSVNWDLKSEQGYAAVRRLIESSDVFIHNVRSDAIARARLSYEDVRSIRPDIVYVHCTGFDQRGPYADLQAYDDIIQAVSGITKLQSRVDGNPHPRYVPFALADKVAGLHAAYAVLAAVIHRLRTGEGQKVEVPMFESVASFNLLEHLCDMTFVPPTGPSCYPRQIYPERQPLATRDGYVAIAPYLDERWVRFFEVTGHPEILKEPQFLEKESRRKNMAQLYTAAAAIMLERTTDEWLEILRNANIPAMRINDIDDLIDDPQLNASNLFSQRMHPTEGKYIEVRPPVRFSAFDYAEPSHATIAGEHSLELARELGLDISKPSP